MIELKENYYNDKIKTFKLLVEGELREIICFRRHGRYYGSTRSVIC